MNTMLKLHLYFSQETVQKNTHNSRRYDQQYFN